MRDIEPLGFNLAIMDGFLTKKTIQTVKEIIEAPARRDQMVTANYEIALRHYSYSVLRKYLNSIMINFFGETVPKHMQKVIKYMAKHIISNKETPQV